MHQQHSSGQRLDPLHEPLVAGGGFDGSLEWTEFEEELVDPHHVCAGQLPPHLHLPLFIYDANADSLFMEVDADVLQGLAPCVETGKEFPLFLVSHVLKDTAKRL